LGKVINDDGIFKLLITSSPKKGELKEASYNGTDMLPNMTTSEKEIEFVKEITYDYENMPPENDPTQALKIKFPTGSVGLNVGALINL